MVYGGISNGDMEKVEERKGVGIRCMLTAIHVGVLEDDGWEGLTFTY